LVAAMRQIAECLSILRDPDLKDMWSLGLDAGSKVVSDARLPGGL
jgi:hypothetical protein